jgi:hypothetical protein
VRASSWVEQHTMRYAGCESTRGSLRRRKPRPQRTSCLSDTNHQLTGHVRSLRTLQVGPVAVGASHGRSLTAVTLAANDIESSTVKLGLVIGANRCCRAR